VHSIADASVRRLRRWQVVTVATLTVGYAAYYVCRSNLSVCLPALASELAAEGIEPGRAKVMLGTLVSWGTLAYAAGKFLSGGIGDFIGGRRNFLGGMIGSAGFTLLFALGGAMPVFTLAWIGNRLAQSLGWVGMVKISSRWFSYSSYGTVMGVVSLSFLFGDALARWGLGELLSREFTWRQVFLVAGGVLVGVLVLASRLVRESPVERGLPEPPADPASLFGARGGDARPESLRALIRPLATSQAFLTICMLSLGCTLLRETFNTWTPTYFKEELNLSPADAGRWSALFPLFGGLSVLAAGAASDVLGRRGRAWIMCLGLLAASATLVVLALGAYEGRPWVAVALVALIAFLLLGPYSYLAGALALDFGSRRGSATASGIIDGVGYLGGVLAGDAVARISVAHGWSGAFATLAAVAGLSSGVAFWFIRQQRVTALEIHGA
jgi:OPA family glycerol-3-phosphate transporter-like MFS transporter